MKDFVHPRSEVAWPVISLSFLCFVKTGLIYFILICSFFPSFFVLLFCSIFFSFPYRTSKYTQPVIIMENHCQVFFLLVFFCYKIVDKAELNVYLNENIFILLLTYYECRTF